MVVFIFKVLDISSQGRKRCLNDTDLAGTLDNIIGYVIDRAKEGCSGAEQSR